MTFAELLDLLASWSPITWEFDEDLELDAPATSSPSRTPARTSSSSSSSSGTTPMGTLAHGKFSAGKPATIKIPVMSNKLKLALQGAQHLKPRNESQIAINPVILNKVTGLRAKYPGWLLRLVSFHAAWEAYYLQSMIASLKLGYTDHYMESTTKCWIFRHVEPPGLGVDFAAYDWFVERLWNGHQFVPPWLLGARLADRGLKLLIHGVAATHGGNYDAGRYSFERDAGEWSGNLGGPDTLAAIRDWAKGEYPGVLQWPPAKATGGTYSAAGLMSKQDYLTRAAIYYQTGQALVHKAEIWRLTRSRYVGSAKHKHEGLLEDHYYGDNYKFDARWTRYCLCWGVPVASNARLTSGKMDSWNDRRELDISGDFPQLEIPWRDMAAMVMQIAPPPGSLPNGHEVGGTLTPFARRPLLDWPTGEFGVLKPHNAGLAEEDSKAFVEAVFYYRQKAYTKSGRGKFDRIAIAVVAVLTSIAGSFAGGAMSAAVNLAYTAATMFLQFLQGATSTGVIDMAALQALMCMALDTMADKLGLSLPEQVQLFDGHLDDVKNIIKWDYLRDLYGESVDLVEAGASEEEIADKLAELWGQSN